MHRLVNLMLKYKNDNKKADCIYFAKLLHHKYYLHSYDVFKKGRLPYVPLLILPNISCVSILSALWFNG